MIKSYLYKFRDEITQRRFGGITALLVALLLVMNFYLMANWNILTGGKPILDEYLGLIPSDYYYLILSYGENGINFYNQIQLLDTFFPFVFNLFLAMGIIKLISLSSKNGDSRLIYLTLLPFLGMLFDYLENIGFFIMVRTNTNPKILFTNLVILVHYWKIILNVIAVILLVLLLVKTITSEIYQTCSGSSI